MSHFFHLHNFEYYKSIFVPEDSKSSNVLQRLIFPRSVKHEDWSKVIDIIVYFCVWNTSRISNQCSVQFWFVKFSLLHDCLQAVADPLPK